MRIEVIYCPACRHKLRIAEDMLGTQVQCPQCQAIFLAPPPPPGSAAEPALALPADDYRREAARPDAGRRVKPPAIALILAGLLHLFLNGHSLFATLARPDEVRRQAQRAQEQVQAIMPVAPVPFDPVRMTAIVTTAFLAVSLLQLLGGLAMLTRRSYLLALLAAVMSMINCGEICCLVSIPIGIWALVVLLSPDVRASFSR